MKKLMIICAHPDDEVFGAGGTIAKLSREGVSTIALVLSMGEGSHPWMKKRVTVQMRREESKKASKIIGTKKTIYLEIPDSMATFALRKKQMQKKIKDIIKKHKPDTIFTHANDDPMPDHNAVSRTVYKIIEEIKFKGSLYSFEVWNPLNISKRSLPKLYVDISKTFHLKIKALKEFKSQMFNALVWLLPSVYFKAICSGIHSKCRFAEVFYKVK